MSTVIRRRYNRIKSLQDGSGIWITEPSDIKQLVLDYFSSLFIEPMPQLLRGHPITGRFPPIQEAIFQDLCNPFTSKNVQLVLQSMNPFKAPGSDGYQALFFQNYYALLGESVFSLVLDVLKGARFPEGLANTFLTLIPKVDNPQ